MSDCATPSTNSSGTPPPGSRIKVKRRPIPRKGHKKSRGGCLTCKRRKVKCDEVIPECGACGRLGLQCVFATKVQARDSSDTSRQLAVLPTLSTDPTWFTLDDMRFFQHFLMSAYPSLPLDGRVIWQEISQMAHEYQFLLHAMLGLGASHLSLMVPNGFSEAALKHRVTALEGFKTFLTKAHLSSANADAAFATALVLTFQATQMLDGVNDFLTMVRGCHLIGQHTIDFETSRFSTLEREAYVQKLNDLISLNVPIPYLYSSAVESCIASLNAIAPLCRSVKELEFLAIMRRIAAEAQRDPKCGYFEHTRIYEILSMLDSDEFATFISDSHYVGRLLVMHMLVLDYALGSALVEKRRITQTPSIPQNVFDYMKMMLLNWVERMSDKLPPEYRVYGAWPVEFARGCMESDKQLPPGGGDAHIYLDGPLRELVL